MKKPNQVEQLISRAVTIGGETAQEANALGFVARCLVMATLPHKAVQGPYFQRTNGDFTLTLTSTDPNLGLPYGSIPRLLLAWIVTEAIRTKSPELELGDSLSAFMRELDLVPTYGRWGTVARLRDQTERLFSCNVRADYRAAGMPHAKTQFDIAPTSMLWWDNPNPSQRGLWQSTVRLSQEFFNEVLAHPVPVDLRALKALKKSPLALDVYTWSTYRASYTKSDTFIPWRGLQGQFGGNYSRLRDFRSSFISELGKVAAIYQGLRFEVGDDGLIVKPSRTHIGRKS